MYGFIQNFTGTSIYHIPTRPTTKTMRLHFNGLMGSEWIDKIWRYNGLERFVRQMTDSSVCHQYEWQSRRGKQFR